MPNLKQHKYTVLSFLIPLGGLLIVRLICTLFFSGVYSMLYSDQYHQYYPFFLEFRRVLRSGDSLLYNWSVGMGMDYLGLISYYLASPLNLLSVIVPDSLTLAYFSLLMPLKLGFAGLFFAIFLKRTFHKDDISIVLFSSFYALCAWALGYQWNIMWLDTFALLPLVTLGAISLLKDRKFILYTITLFLSIFSNYYIGLFTCIFILLVFICYEICKWKGYTRFLMDLLLIALFSILAIGMTAILELPAISALQSTQSSNNTFPTEFKLNIATTHDWRGLLDAMRQVAGNTNGGLAQTYKEGLPNLYCGVFPNILMFLFLTCRRINWREKICYVFLVLFFNVSFIIRQLDYIWHGFHFTNMIPYRFSFLYSFVALVAAYRAWLLRRSFRHWQVITAALFSITILLFCNSIPDFLNLVNGNVMLSPWSGRTQILSNLTTLAESCAFLIYTGIFLILYTVAFAIACRWRKPPYDGTLRQKKAFLRRLSRRRELSRKLFCYFMAAEIVANLLCFGFYFTPTNAANYPSRKEDVEKAVAEMNHREKDTLFYRAETTHSQTLNDGAINNYNGVSTFTSSANVNVTRFMKGLGYGARDTYNRYCYEESSPVSNLFLNLKYMIERDGVSKDHRYFTDVFQSGYVHLLENNAYLPLGFMVENQILNVDFLTHRNPFDIQNDLMQASTGVREDVWKYTSYNSLVITGNNAQITSQLPYGYCTYSTDPNTNGNVVYSYTADNNGFMCINLVLEKRNDFSVIVNGQTLYSENYSISQMIAVSNVNVGDVIEVVLHTDANDSGFIEVTAAILDDAIFQQCYDILNTSTWNLTDFSNTRVEGTIHCQKDGIMYTSIPQDGNWVAYVDGKPTDVVLISDAMCGVMLTEGDHTVTFQYRNNAFSYGWKISLVSLILFIAACVLVYHPRSKHKKGKFEF